MMKKYFFKKTIDLLMVMLGVSILIFIMSLWIPGDVAEMILAQSGIDPTPSEVMRVREELGLDRPLLYQYLDWVTDLLKGDFGTSYRTGRPVQDELLLRLPWSLLLAVTALGFTLLIVLPLGILSAVYKGRPFDYLTRVLSVSLASMPSFLLGLLMLYVFAVKGSYFNITGNGSARDVILPALTLALGMSPSYIRLLRSLIIDALEEDYITVARSRGLKESTLLLAHALKRSLLPMLTQLGMSFGHLLGGTVIVENIFAWPGVGQFLMLSIFNRDYPVIQVYVLWMALIFVAVNAFVDYAYAWINPQIRIGRSK